ncbi:SAV_6107 family HEPN domain-containing protein [Gordonia aichiensis]|uniref:SAV_6107 family HEPN domain-containing protein n=1 Tax=Gordonia aichiensis TaxID=36820 RepID=UPI00326753D4
MRGRQVTGRRSTERHLSVAAARSRGTEADPRLVNRGRGLLERAEQLFDQAATVGDDEAERFRLLYLAAIRAAGAVLEVCEPARRRRGAADAWSRVKAYAPQCAELAEYFGGLSTMRAHVEAGLVRSIDPTLCARVERRAVEFLDVADSTLLAYEQGKCGARPGAVRGTVA